MIPPGIRVDPMTGFYFVFVDLVETYKLVITPVGIVRGNRITLGVVTTIKHGMKGKGKKSVKPYQVCCLNTGFVVCIGYTPTSCQ